MAAWVSQVIHDVDFEKLLLLQTENSSIDCCSLFFSDGTNWSQSLGSLQQVVDEFLKIDKCKICWTVNCEDKCFVHSRLWFLWKTWNHWGCPDKRFKINIWNIDTNLLLLVLLTRINFFLWFSSSMSSISSRSMSTSFGNSVCNKKYLSKQNKIISVNTALN